jgi:hypothetical protein
MKTRKNDPQALEEVLRNFAKSNKLEKGLDNVRIEQLWSKLLGSGVQAYTKSVRLSSSTLYVELSSSVLREELSYGKDNIINMLNEGMQKECIKKIVLR